MTILYHASTNILEDKQDQLWIWEDEFQTVEKIVCSIATQTVRYQGGFYANRPSHT